MHRPVAIFLPFLLWLLIPSRGLQAQVETARVVGTITDASGATVAGAAITVVNTQTNVSFQSVADEKGRYGTVPLRIGEYRIVVEHSGFKRATRGGIVLQIQQTAQIDIELEIGSVAEEVLVTSTAPLLNTADGTQGQVVNNQKIVDLPLNGRDYVQLALLSSGANQPPSGARLESFSGSGMRVSENNFLLDGIDNNIMQNAAQGRQAEAVKPSVDAIEEFKILTNAFSAEYGRAAGAIVNVTLKSGSNQLHGTVFEFLRNEKLDAKNFFDSPTARRAPFKRNQYGFSLGGPIVRNRTFFFGDYEGTRIRESATALNTIPTTLMTKGDFSELLPQTRIFDPSTFSAATRQRDPFPGNIIPASRLDPVGAKVASFYPAPNRPGLIQNFLLNPPDRSDQHRWDVKIDHTFRSSDTIYGRYSAQRRLEPGGAILPPPAYGGTSAADQSHNSQNAALAHNHIFSPELFVSTKIGWNMIDSLVDVPYDRNINRELGLTGVDTSRNTMAFFQPAGYATIGAGVFNPNSSGSQARQLLSDASWMRGSHSVKFGVNLTWIQRQLQNPRISMGRFVFNRAFTRNSMNLQQGDAIADLLLGAASQADISNDVHGDERMPYYDFYVEDQWRATQRLTLNFGLRYEFHRPFLDRNNHYSNLDFSDPRAPSLLVAQDGGSRFNRALVHDDKNDFGPRFGFAYKLDGKTTARGGYGVYYGSLSQSTMVLFFNPPSYYAATLTTDPNVPSIFLRQGLPPGVASAANAQNIGLNAQDVTGRHSYAQQWNFSLQRELPGQMMVEVGYYANTMHKQSRSMERNYALPGPGNVAARRVIREVPIPSENYVLRSLAGILSYEPSANANFHSMQTRIEKRLSAGLSFLGTYMWSKSISDSGGGSADGGTGSQFPQNPLDLRAERALASEHIGHRFVSSVVYDLPFGRGRARMATLHPMVDAVLGGWTISGIATRTSGPYVNLSVLGSPSNSGNPDRPSVAGDWRLEGDQRTVQRWFNTAAFVPNAPFTFGNAGRNLIEAPGVSNLDFAVYKQFRINERARVQFRWESFNFTNTPQFGLPNAQVGNANFGVIGSAGRPRNMQFGLKVIF